MVKHYCFGKTVISVETPVPMREDPRFEAFAVEEREAHLCFTVQPKEKEPRRDNGANAILQAPDNAPNRENTDTPPTEDPRRTAAWPVTTQREGKRITVYMNTDLLPDITVANLLISANAAWELISEGSFLLHASYVCHNGEAILFTAPCGTGKSTQAGFWHRERGSMTVNEDRVLIFAKDGIFYAAGCWATGSAGVTHNVTAPIRAVVLLGQGKENTVTRPKPSVSLPRLLAQCSYNTKDPSRVGAMFGLLCDLLSAVPILAYDCVNHPSSVADLEKHL